MKSYYLLVTLLCVKTSWAIQDENPANDHFKSVFKEHLNGDNATLSPDEVKYHYPWHDFTTDEVKEATNQTEARKCPKPHASWHEYKGKYYNLLSHQTCRLPECMETCSLNDATLIFPETMDEFHKIQNLYHDGQPPLILGAYLPFEYPEAPLCFKEQCDSYLLLANGSNWKYESWMGNRFDRTYRKQGRCYAIGYSDVWRLIAEVIPIDCGLQYRAICVSDCPRPGIPIYPSTQDIQEETPIRFQYHNGRRDIGI